MADYNIVEGGTNTSGVSADFTVAEGYADLALAATECIDNGSENDRVVFDNGVFEQDGTNTTGWRILNNTGDRTFTVTQRGTTLGDTILRQTSQTGNTLVNMNSNVEPDAPTHDVTFSNLTFDSTINYEATAARPFSIVNDQGNVTFESCRFINFSSMHEQNNQQGRLIRTGGGARTVTLTDVDVVSPVIGILDGSSATARTPLLALEADQNITLDNVKITGGSFTSQGADQHSMIRHDGGGTLTITNSNFVANDFATADATPVGSMIQNHSTGDCTISGCLIADNTYTPFSGQNISAGFFSDNGGASSSQNHTVTNSTFARNIVSTLANNRLGGLVRSQTQGSLVTVEDCIAENNVGFFGALADASSGGAFTVRRCIARYNKGGLRSPGNEVINGVSVYFGGGAEDCTMEATTIYGHYDDIIGSAVYIHNSNTPDTPGPRTVTISHCSILNNSGSPIAIVAQNALTVNFVNCHIEGNINCGAGTDTLLTVNFTNCATTAASMATLLTNNTPDTVSETGTVSAANMRVTESGQPYADSPLMLAGSNTAVVTGVDGVAYDLTTPNIGAYGGAYIRSRARHPVTGRARR